MITLSGADFRAPQPTDGSESPEYQRTLRALDQYRLLAAEDDGEMLPAIINSVKAGEHYAGVPRLNRLLSLLGDLPAPLTSVSSDVYDERLVAGVRRFQTRHGLEPDGRIGKATLAELNRPLSYRVRQLELALERWRRRPYDPARREIVLNLPEFRLRAFGISHQPELEMKIVIGRAPKLKTPLLSAEINAIIFRPYWNVPLSIQRKELVAEIARDSSYISKNDFELVTAQGIVAAENTVSDTMLAQLRSGKLRLRQRPGPKDALGLVKFVFPNEYDVYMHDTPAKSLFARARRDFSHGCIRLERAEDLAEWVLREEIDWRRNRIAAAMEGTETTSVKLTNPIPVVTMYVTAVVLESGEVHFLDDIYGEDARLEKELAASTQESAVTSDGSGQYPRE